MMVKTFLRAASNEASGMEHSYATVLGFCRYIHTRTDS